MFGLREHVEELVLFGRLDPEPGRAPYALPPGVRLVPLPHYESVRSIPRLVRTLRGARRTFTREAAGLDGVWVFGPNPAALVFIQALRRRGVRVFLGVRQDFPEYVRNRLPSRRWAWALAVAEVFERVFQRLARTMPTVVVGEALGRAYSRGGGRVLATGFSLIRERDLATVADAQAKPWNADIQLVTVGRVDREKNPLLLPEILALLGPRYRLAVVGIGPLEDALLERARELGVADRIDMRGYVRNGDELWVEYRRAHAFLHVSLTEGLPQVLFEAQAQALPVVATDVGGVSDALGGGRTGLLVPPRDAHAAADAVRRLDDEELRLRLVEAGLANASHETLDAQIARVAQFFRESR